MKKLLSAALVMFMVLGLSGCSSEDKKEETPTGETKKEETKKAVSFETIESMLKDNGFAISKTTEMGAQMIGAEKGKKYETENGKFEFYQFDVNSDAYKKAESEGKVTMEGFGDFEVVVNNGYALMTQNASEELINLFKAL